MALHLQVVVQQFDTITHKVEKLMRGEWGVYGLELVCQTFKLTCLLSNFSLLSQPYVL